MAEFPIVYNQYLFILTEEDGFLPPPLNSVLTDNENNLLQDNSGNFITTN